MNKGDQLRFHCGGHGPAPVPHVLWMRHQPTRVLFGLVSRTLIVAACVGLLPAAASAQSATPVDHRLRVLLDCQDEVCDQDFTRRYLTHVDFVRDRAVADIHILVTYRNDG